MCEKSNKMIFEEVLAVINGKDPTEARKEAKLRSRIYKKSLKYVKKPVEDWPDISMNWDVSTGSQRFSLDGVSIEKFEKIFPDGFLLGYVSFPEMDTILTHYSRRDEGELWEVGNESKLARLIVYLSEGRPISPPLVKPLQNGEVILQGGHHRYAIAKEIGVKRLPIHVEKQYKLQIDCLLNVEWGTSSDGERIIKKIK